MDENENLLFERALIEENFGQSISIIFIFQIVNIDGLYIRKNLNSTIAYMVFLGDGISLLF